jgi:hypothetical protein
MQITKPMPRDPHTDMPLDVVPEFTLAMRLESWLIREARFLPGNREVLEQFCQRVADAGVPIDRVSLHQRAFHPQYPASAASGVRTASSKSASWTTASRRPRSSSRARFGP